MAAIIPPVYVNNPHPLVPRYGLFDVAVGPLDLPEHARAGGLDYQTDACQLPDGYAIACTPDVTEKTFDDGPDTITGTPFVVRSSLTCGAVGLTEQLLRQRLVNRLRAGEQAAVENIFSAAAVGQSPGLPGASVVTPDCTDIVGTVGALEEALYSTYGLIGVLHVPFLAASFMKDHHLVEKDGRIWRTVLGTAVSIGNYNNSSPADPQVPAAAGAAWIYITGSVAIWRTPDSQVFTTSMAQALNRTTNQVLGQAEREYVVTFECGSFAAEATLCTVA